MAQQPKKRNVAALSYSSLHEKLGEANREVKKLKASLETTSEDFKRKSAETIQTRKAYYAMKDKRNRLKKLLVITNMTLVAVIIVLLVFTLTK